MKPQVPIISPWHTQIEAVLTKYGQYKPDPMPKKARKSKDPSTTAIESPVIQNAVNKYGQGTRQVQRMRSPRG